MSEHEDNQKTLVEIVPFFRGFDLGGVTSTEVGA